jgi:Protein of unknown function (DUF2818)
MNSELGVWALIGLALVLANAPFFYRRLFLFYWPKTGKSLGLHVAELVTAYFIVGIFGRWIEGKLPRKTGSFMLPRRHFF